MNIPLNSHRKSALNIRIVAAILVALGVVGGGTAYFSTKGESDKSQVVAEINGQAVTLDEADARLKILQRQVQQGKKSEQDISFLNLKPEEKEAVIREEAAHRLLVKDAKKQNLIEASALKEQKERFEENLLRKLLLERIANDAVNENKIKEEYENQVNKIKGQQEVHARHILVKTEEEARKVKAELDTKSFKDVAKEMSLDQKTAKDGGDLGTLYTGNMLKGFEEAINKLKPGETSDPVQSEFGWHIIKLDSKAPAKILTYDRVRSKVAIEISKQAIKEYVNELLNKVKIKIL